MWDRQQGYIAAVFASNDAREGATAFAEKRKPIRAGTCPRNHRRKRKRPRETGAFLCEWWA